MESRLLTYENIDQLADKQVIIGSLVGEKDWIRDLGMAIAQAQDAKSVKAIIELIKSYPSRTKEQYIYQHEIIKLIEQALKRSIDEK